MINPQAFDRFFDPRNLFLLRLIKLLLAEAVIGLLRRLVAAGQYHVSPKYLAMKIFKAAGLEE